MGMFTPQTTSTTDSIAQLLNVASRFCLVLGIGLLPILFIPNIYTPLLDGKLYISTFFVSLALVVSALMILRIGTLQIPYSLTLLGAWLVALAAVASAALSGDLADSLGTFSGTLYTATTIVLGMFTLTVVSNITQDVRSAVWLMATLGMVSSLLILWHAVRLITGLDLSFGLFPNQTTSVLGAWGDVAIVSAAVVIALLVAASQSLLNWWQRWFGVVVLIAALFVLAVINNTVLWGVLGIVSLSIVVMAITRRQAQMTPSFIEGSDTRNLWLLGYASLIFMATLAVYLGGETLQRTLNDVTNTSFVEVRPSVGASLDIVRSVWKTDILTGVGPARYADAWRLYKVPGINETIFWNVDFTSGYNFFVTQVVELGLLGFLAWFVFLGALILSGVRTFIISTTSLKHTQYKVALLAFVLAVFLWFSFFIEVPGVPIFIIATAMTGLYIGMSYTIRPRQLVIVSLAQNQKVGFVVVSLLVVLCIAITWGLQQATKQVLAATKLNAALAQPVETELATISSMLNEAFALYSSDTIARAHAVLYLNRMKTLLGVTEPTIEDQQMFQNAVQNAINLSNLATTLDSTNPENWYVQAQVYAVLAQAEVEGAFERAASALDQAALHDPHSPRVPLARAELAILQKDFDAAREHLTAAIQKKTNYAPALYLLAQIEIAEGNVAEAITITESITSLEPNNPARWYQLGLLYEANGDTTRAIQALSRAIQLDGNFANALYIRGLLRAQRGEVTEAEADLRRVLELNPDNEQVQAQLDAIVNGSFTTTGNTSRFEQAVSEEEVITDVETVSAAAAETDLITTTTNSPSSDDELTSDENTNNSESTIETE